MELHFIKRGLRASPFTNSLAINLLTSLAEFRERVVDYINMEKVQEIRKEKAWWRMEGPKTQSKVGDKIKEARGNQCLPKGEGPR